MVPCSAVRKLLVLVAFVACAKSRPPEAPPVRPSILLVTLDTTRADAVRPDVAPNFNSIARRGLRFTQAYTPVPQTLSAHCSIMTGLYPAGHGVHENGRYLSNHVPVLAEQMKAGGYRTAAFVSAFALARRFRLGRGFDVYDEGAPVKRGTDFPEPEITVHSTGDGTPPNRWRSCAGSTGTPKKRSSRVRDSSPVSGVCPASGDITKLIPMRRKIQVQPIEQRV